MNGKRKGLVLLALVLALMPGCGGGRGEPAPVTEQTDGLAVVAPEIQQPQIDGTLVQSPVAFFARTNGVDYPFENEQDVDNVSAEMVQAYMDLLVNEFGYVLNDEDLSFVCNTWRFLLPGSGTDPGEYNVYNDVKVIHYYDSDFHDNTLDVTVSNENYRFADFGYRYTGENVQSWSGQRATDAYILQKNHYVNASDGALRVPAREREESSYSYTKPFASEFYTYTSINGLCSLIVNGSGQETHSALLCDFNNFESNDNDMLLVWHEDGSDLLKLRWEKGTFQSGEVYNLNDILVYGDIDIDYGGETYTVNSVDAFTLRPLWLDRAGETDSLVYFYIEVGDGEGGTELTLEGLVAAPFNLAANSTHTSAGDGGSVSSGIAKPGKPNVAQHSRLDCLTCHGDGDCNNCGGSGYVYYGGTRTACSTCNRSGNCRACGGTGKR